VIRRFSAFAAVLALSACATEKLEYVVVNPDGAMRPLRHVIVFPFILDEADTGKSGKNLEERGDEATIVIRDQLEPYLFSALKHLKVASWVDPGVAGEAGIKAEDAGGSLYAEVEGIISRYAHHSAVDSKSLNQIISLIDPSADGLLLVRIDQYHCERSNPRPVEFKMRGFLFAKDQHKAIWVAQDSTRRYFSENFKKEQGAFKCHQDDYFNEGKMKIDLFVQSMPFQ